MTPTEVLNEIQKMPLNDVREIIAQAENYLREQEEHDFDSADLMRLSENGGALDFLNDEPDIYTLEDLKVHYK